MVNKFCDSKSIEVAYNLIDRLKLTKSEFARLCGVSAAQFCNWQKNGRLPEYRYSFLVNELKKKFKKEYDEKLKLLEDENE